MLWVVGSLALRLTADRLTPQTLVFNANLQDFSQRVGQISNLQSNGKLSAQEAYALGILPKDEND